MAAAAEFGYGPLRGLIGVWKGGTLTLQPDAAGGGVHAIGQAPFMLAKARTLAFQQTLVPNGDAPSCEETTVLDIYGRRFHHKDKSRLQRLS